jgi:hypothetical protein
MMLLLSEGTRRLIEAAVEDLDDSDRRQVWQAWANSHQRARRADDPWDDGGAALPRAVIEVALLALSERGRRMRSRLDEISSEDEIADLDNDLSHIKSVIRLLTEGPPRRR